MKSISIMVVEDEKFLRKLICKLIEKSESLNAAIIAETDDGYNAIQLAMEHKPDVIIMDINIHGLNGIDASRRILKQNPDSKIIILSSLSTRTAIIEMLRVGAMGFLPKQDSYDEELIRAITVVSAGEIYFSKDIIPIMREYFAVSVDSSGNIFLSLSVDDTTLARLSAENQSLKEIAEFMDVTVPCIAKRRERILEKLGIQSMPELVSLAIREGLISPTIEAVEKL